MTVPIFPEEYYVIFNQSSFSGTSDPCAIWAGSGTCYSWGNFGVVSGTLNGDGIIIEGDAQIDLFLSYHFVIHATTKETGDIDGNGQVDLSDAVRVLQIISAMNPSEDVYNEAR